MNILNKITWDLILESNIINVLIFILILLYLAWKFLPKILREKNQEISEVFHKAEDRSLKAEEELKNTTKLLKEYKDNSNERQAQKDQMIESIKTNLRNENTRKLEAMRERCQREIQKYKEINEYEIKKELIDLSIEETKKYLSKNLAVDEFNDKALQEIVKLGVS